MKASGARLRPSTQPIPTMLVMLSDPSGRPKVWASQMLPSPILGWSRNSQPIADAKPGIKRPMVIRVNRMVLPRKSVRSASQSARNAEQQRDHERDEGEADGVEEDVVGLRLAEHIDVVVEVVFDVAVARQAFEEAQPGDHDQERDDDDADREDGREHCARQGVQAAPGAKRAAGDERGEIHQPENRRP